MHDADGLSRPKPENRAHPASAHPLVTRRRSLAKAISWRVVGSLDTLLLSYLLIAYLGPVFGLEHSKKEALGTAGLIATAEVVTKMVLYYLHERFWEWNRWGTFLTSDKRRESYSRSTSKTATWRVLASLDTMLLAWLFTGNIATAASIGGLEVVTKLILYFFHERIWSHVDYGIAPGAAPPAALGKSLES